MRMAKARTLAAGLILACALAPGRLQAEDKSLTTAYDGISRDVRSSGDEAKSRRAAAPTPECAAKRGFFEAALASEQGIDGLLGQLVSDADDVVILAEEHHTQAMDVEPEILALLSQRSRRLNCVFMELRPGLEKSWNLKSLEGTGYSPLYKRIVANGQKLVFVDEFKDVSPHDPAMNVGTRNKGMADEIRRALSAPASEPGRCTGGIMIVGKGHAMSSWAGRSIVSMQSYLDNAGLKVKVINLLPFPPRATIGDYTPNDAQLLSGDCPIGLKALKAPLGYKHPPPTEKIPYYPRAGLVNDFDATIFVP